MDEIESQIAKIQLGNIKTSSSYVFVMAEKAASGDSELYVVAEMPLFNPAAEESCERICLAIASTLKKAYRRNPGENAFENAISLINEELGKLASLGQTEWINKLNCILGVKNSHNFNIASCGKVSAYLLRNKEYTDISCSPPQSHPLKTFENYASGKIRLGDLLILSTTQLFNYLSMDRLLKVVSNSDFLTATKTVIELLKQNSDPQVSFGILLNLQVPLGQTSEEEADLENYIVDRTGSGSNFIGKAFAYIKTAFAFEKKVGRTPQVALPKISFGQRIKNFGGNTKNFVSRGKGLLGMMSAGSQASFRMAKSAFKPENFKQLSGQKKFFLISAVVLFIAVIINIGIALHLQKTGRTTGQTASLLKQTQDLLSSAQSSLLYKDDAAATNYLKQANEKIPQANTIDSGNKDLYNKVLAQLNDTKAQMEKTIQAQVVNLGALGAGSSLIKLPSYIATQVNQTIISYNLQNSKIEDNVLSSPVAIVLSTYLSGNTAAVYDGSNLYVWDFSLGKLSSGFNQAVPAKNDFAGMAEYPTNKRVYLIDKKSTSIISYLPTDSGFSKPVVALRDQVLTNALDIAIDGSIYVLGPSGISKFQNGQPATFATNNLVTPYSNSGKIYTDKNLNNIYVLDSGNNRILILDKKGALQHTLKSGEFTKLTDFKVDEKNKLIYVLNDGSLLKVSLP